MKGRFVIVLLVALTTISGCTATRRGMKADNTYYSNQYPSVQITLGENFEYRKGESGQFQHQFIDEENHRRAFIHTHLHYANQTQIDYYNNPEGWIYSLPENSVELNRFTSEFVGEKWYIQDAVYHPSTATCLLLRDLSVFTETNDIFKLRYAWEIPPYNCDKWKAVDSLSVSQEQYIKEFLDGFADDVTISNYVEDRDSKQFKTIGLENELSEVNHYSINKKPQSERGVSVAVSKGDSKKVVIFPWVLHGEAETFLQILKESIRYYVGETDELKLEKSYYEIKKVAKLNIPGSGELYNGNSPNVELIKELTAEEGAQLAVLGSMNIHCKWADECHVRQMETILVDVVTGDVQRVVGGSGNLDAREVVTSTVKKAFGPYMKEM